ncbi:DUF6584 family protein [Flavobacterium sp. AG291]|uniref:DUF6584 family protein n=1 Tax=Flavobacterium sp. AG291 TaxID=2184000 RepID=UPI000E09FBC0|nr:DUF6584 family protein [Flavobacterium sp. AG291]RDI12093.1 hypothetical protein DEU42_10425 [Flavobacterium sp. AG291]
MYLQNQLQQAEAEIKKGQKFKAVNRLKNVINSFPDEMGARAMLAQLYYEAGFYDAAGLYWILAEPTEDYIKECVTVYKTSVNYSPIQILKDIKYRGDKLRLPAYALQTLDQLEQEKYKKNQSSKKYKQRLAEEAASKRYDWIGGAVFLLIALVFIFGFVNGIISLWNIIFN